MSQLPLHFESIYIIQIAHLLALESLGIPIRKPGESLTLRV